MSNKTTHYVPQIRLTESTLPLFFFTLHQPTETMHHAPNNL